MSGDVNAEVLLVGAGPMAVAYGHVLNGLGASWCAIGRGAASAAKFEAATGKKPILGGFAPYLQNHAPLSAVAVIIALPVPQLAEAVKAFVAAGASRILVEKPAGLTVQEIDKVAQAAAGAASQVFVGYNRRFYASVNAARELIAEDGGVTSFHMEFTEFISKIISSVTDPALLQNLLIANSSHVIDLAFHLCGEPSSLCGIAAGQLDWHPAGAIFVGHGRTKAGAVFSWHADWMSAGRWGLDVRTPRRRLLFQPLETLAVQEKASLAILPHAIADDLDRKYKPGIYRQTEAFLSDDPSTTALPTIAAHSQAVRRWYSGICAPAA